ncbi:hypothetical protein PybrP1_001393 [[Pythium] brassicae (nom. inval.)]|nr:hypothetical protein PybrP1_001393 [[Pythium] brassicae (nom. inval.)]
MYFSTGKHDNSKIWSSPPSRQVEVSDKHKSTELENVFITVQQKQNRSNGFGASASDDLIGKAFFFDDDEEFAQTFERRIPCRKTLRFAESRCLSFDIDSDNMKLEYTAELFESKLEGQSGRFLFAVVVA